jgi:hypothetical protein
VLAAPANPAGSRAPLHIQRFAGHPTTQRDTAPASVHRVLASPGRPLDPALQQDMGQRFSHDFSQVRVHSGSAAEQSAQDVSARAYTVGRDIVFGADQFAPETSEGRRLIAHELTHVVQQCGIAAPGNQQENSSRIPFTPTVNKFDRVLVQREEFGEDVRFDSVSGPPPRAYVLGPYPDPVIAAELYGDSTIPIVSLSESELLIDIDYERLLPRWKPLFRDAVEVELGNGNRWPFAGFPPDESDNYIDEQTSALAINLVSGVAILTVKGADSRIEVPLVWFDATEREVVPVYPIEASREAATASLSDFQKFSELSGITPILFYRDANRLVWPTIISPQTAPGIMSVYPQALDAARQEVKATEEGFVDLLFWYIGARMVRGRRPTKPAVGEAPLGAAAGKVAAKSIAEISDELYTATAAIKANGPRFIKAASILSSREGLTALEKVKAIQSFATRIGFGFSKRGLIDEGAHLILYSEDELYAFRFVKESGRILYGKLSKEAISDALLTGKEIPDYVWTLLQ